MSPAMVAAAAVAGRLADVRPLLGRPQGLSAMDKFTRLTATACPLNVTNLNTDQLLPARYLKWPRAAGLGKVLLQDLRFDSEGREQADFPLNRPPWRDAKIIVAGRNFGCGSSREAAVYALYDYGIRCVIAPSFGDIFAGNAIQNGLLTAAVPDDVAAELMATLATTPETPVTVDLEQQTIICGNHSYGFASIRSGACGCSMAGTISRSPKASPIGSRHSKRRIVSTAHGLFRLNRMTWDDSRAAIC